MLSSSQRGALYLRLALRLLIVVAVICAIAFLTGPVIYLFGPFIFALVIAWMLNPLIRGLNRRLDTSRRFLSFIVVLLMFLSAGAIIALVVYKLFSELVDLASNWQAIWEGFQPVLEYIEELVDRLSTFLPVDASGFLDTLGETIVSWVETRLSSTADSLVTVAGSLATSVASGAVAVLVFIVAAYFITADYPRIRWKARQFFGQSNHFIRILRDAAGSALGGYLKAQLILSGAVGLIILVALLIWGQDYSLIIAIITAIIDFVPFFGSGIVLVPWAVVSFISGSTTKAIFLVILSFGLFLFRKLAEPKVVGNHTGLSPLTSLVSIYVGMRVGGVLGMIFVPILVMIVITMYRVGAFQDSVDDLKAVVLDIKGILTVPPSEEKAVEAPKAENEPK